MEIPRAMSSPFLRLEKSRFAIVMERGSVLVNRIAMHRVYVAGCDRSVRTIRTWSLGVMDYHFSSSSLRRDIDTIGVLNTLYVISDCPDEYWAC